MLLNKNTPKQAWVEFVIPAPQVEEGRELEVFFDCTASFGSRVSRAGFLNMWVVTPSEVK